MTTQLRPLPEFDDSVRYALTVPQSVLFADLSLQGSRRNRYQELLGIDYESNVIVIDSGGRMSWNYGSDVEFDSALKGIAGSKLGAIRLFVDAMEASSRHVERTARDIARRGPWSNAETIRFDLMDLWHSYELQMVTLFSFWNAEAILQDVLVTELKANGLDDEIAAGLPRFLEPYQENYFGRERRVLGETLRRNALETSSSQDADAALASHVRHYGFLLTPFNLGSLPRIEDVLESAPVPADSHIDIGALSSLRSHSTISPEVLDLYVLSRKFAFWKSERLDVLALSDALVVPLYEAAADMLGLTVAQLVTMTSDEILRSLQAGLPVVSTRVLIDRGEGFCLALSDSEVSFYLPSQMGEENANVESFEIGDTMSGLNASSGEVTGPVRVATSPEQAMSIVRDGDVLVTRMTRPEYGPALQRAAAFVTDEGGLLSHAAIISREQGKPCVTATGNATQVLRNGDLVRVDGANGIIELIARG